MTPSHPKNKSENTITPDKKRSKQHTPPKKQSNPPPAAESTADNMGFITHANVEFAKLWGYESVNEVIGKPIPRFFNDKDQATRILTACERKGFWEGEFHAQRKNGSTFITRVKSSLIRDANGMRIALHAKFFDSTDGRR